MNTITHGGGDGVTGTSTTVTGPTAETEYWFEVWSYSARPCDRYSPSAYDKWTR